MKGLSSRLNILKQQNIIGDDPMKEMEQFISQHVPVLPLMHLVNFQNSIRLK